MSGCHCNAVDCPCERKESALPSPAPPPALVVDCPWPEDAHQGSIGKVRHALHDGRIRELEAALSEEHEAVEAARETALVWLRRANEVQAERDEARGEVIILRGLQKPESEKAREAADAIRRLL